MTDFTVQPLNLQNGSYTAKQDRQFTDAVAQGEGVVGADDFRITATGSSMILTSGATTKLSSAFVRGDTNSDQALYEISQYAGITVTIGTADATNPRIDQIVLRIYDKTEAGGSADKATIEVVAGTATSGATLDNRNGATSLPASALLLADVLVGATVTSISQSNVRDRRAFAYNGPVPMIVTNTTNPVVAFEDPPGVLSEYAQGSTSAAGVSVSDNGKQTTILQYLPTRIVGATRIKFRYVQGTTAIAAGAFVISIYDASGRKVIDTGSINYSSYSTSAGAIVSVSATITATTFESGLYYVLFGTTGSTASSFANFLGSNPRTAFAPNLCYHSNVNGVTTPTALTAANASIVDSSTIDPVATRLPYVPNIILSVG